MTIEAMNKPDLVKEVRRLTQDLKISNARVKALEESVVSDTSVKAQEQAVKSSELEALPFVAVSIVKGKEGKFKLVQVRFNLDGEAIVDQRKEKLITENYQASFAAAKLIATVIEKQEE